MRVFLVTIFFVILFNRKYAKSNVKQTFAIFKSSLKVHFFTVKNNLLNSTNASGNVIFVNFIHLKKNM